MGKPQDLPAGRSQLHIGVALALVSYVLALAIPYGVGRAFMQAVIDLGCTALAIWVALLAVGRAERFEQSFGGLCGASAFINVAAIPIFALRPDISPVDTASAASLADFVLLVWSLSLLAFILRHTFEVKMVSSILLSVAFFITLSSIVAQLWPAQGQSIEIEQGACNLCSPAVVDVNRVFKEFSADTVA